MTARPPRTRRARRLVLGGGAAALVVLLLLYARCRGGLGLGGGGSPGTPAPPATAAHADAAPAQAAPADAGTDAAPPRCQLRVDGDGVALDGTPASIDRAVAACKAAGAADVLVTGDAVQGQWDRLRAALDGAGVKTFVRGAPAATTDGGAAAP